MISIHPAVNYIVSLVAGILILVFPALLNFIVAIYLIIVGVVGILGLMQTETNLFLEANCSRRLRYFEHLYLSHC